METGGFFLKLSYPFHNFDEKNNEDRVASRKMENGKCSAVSSQL